MPPVLAWVSACPARSSVPTSATCPCSAATSTRTAGGVAAQPSAPIPAGTLLSFMPLRYPACPPALYSQLAHTSSPPLHLNAYPLAQICDCRPGRGYKMAAHRKRTPGWGGHPTTAAGTLRCRAAAAAGASRYRNEQEGQAQSWLWVATVEHHATKEIGGGAAGVSSHAPPAPAHLGIDYAGGS